MRAITRTKYGGPEVLTVDSIPEPAPAENQIKVRVHFASVSRTDCGILRGQPFPIRFFTGLTKPKHRIPGSDFGGEVVAIGSEVTQYQIGDLVWGLNDNGLRSYADCLTINADETICKLPKNTTLNEAVACAEGGFYAYNFLNKVRVNENSKILINGATGAIGINLLQLVKQLSADVTVVGNTKNVELLKSLGAKKVHDYTQEDFTKIDTGQYDFIFDAVGKSSFGACKHLLKPEGTYISSELGPGMENLYLPLLTKLKKSKRVIFPVPTHRQEALLYLNQLLQSGALQGVVDRTYKPTEVKQAFEYVEGENKTGAVLLDFG